MKSYGIWFLCILAFLPLLAKMAVVGDYALRKSYYAAELCEKRATPQASCCEARCQLKKNLQQIEQTPAPQSQSETPTTPFSGFKFDYYFFPGKLVPGALEFFALSLCAPGANPAAPLFDYVQGCGRRFVGSLVQPPEA